MPLHDRSTDAGRGLRSIAVRFIPAALWYYGTFGTGVLKGWTARNSNTRFRLIAIPDEEPIAVSSLNFEPASSGKGWAREPPRLEALERISRR